MSSLILVRHAQASFGADDYDKLSELGETQSTLLGGYWVNAQSHFDHVLIGPRLRHRETAALAERVFRDAGHPWDEQEHLESLDEYQGESLIKKALPRLIGEDTHLQSLAAAFADIDHEDPSAKRKAFQKMFEHVMRSWVRGEIEEPGVESWQAFTQRITDLVRDVQSRYGRKKTIVAFTSGGVIGAAVGVSLGLSPEKAIETSWMVHNASLTEFTFTEDRFTLSRFNALPHLHYPRLITYR